MSKLTASSPVPRHVPQQKLISIVAQCESPEDICGRTYPADEQIAKEITRRWDEGRFGQVEASHDIHTADMEAVRQAIDDVISRFRK